MGALGWTTIILVLLLLPVTNKRTGNLGERLHARGPVVTGVRETCLVELNVGTLTLVVVTGNCEHPLQLLLSDKIE